MKKGLDPCRPLGWSKFDSQTVRRSNVQRCMRGDLMEAGRAMEHLARTTIDRETQQKANADAKYFFNKYRAKQGR